MVRMIDLIKRGGGEAEEEPDRRRSPEEQPPGSLPEEGPLRFPSAEELVRGSAPPAPQARSAAPPPAAPPAPPALSREQQGSLLQGDLEESRGSLRTTKKLDVKQRYCPHLGGKLKRESVQDYPAASNVCYAQESQEKKLLRTITLPFAAIPAQRQREFCLSASYARCPVFQAKEKGAQAP
ncbi:MAG: hypothetical protein AABZ64_10315 [Nitrospinota bacterium]